jgi:glutamine amidotransferase
MADDVAQSVARMVGFIERVGAEKGIENPVQMSLGICDGQSLYAFRYSTEGQSRSLFHSIDIAALREIAPHLEDFSDDARAIVSDLHEAWVPGP